MKGIVRAMILVAVVGLPAWGQSNATKPSNSSKTQVLAGDRDFPAASMAVGSTDTFAISAPRLAGASAFGGPWTPAAPPRCGAAGVTVTLEGIQGALGELVAGFIVRNTGSRSCSLSGYPGFQLLAAHGQPLPTHVTRDHTTPPHLVVIQPGGTAGIAVKYRSFDDQTQQPCRPIADEVGIILPNDTVQVVTSAQPPQGQFKMNPCNGAVLVSPVQQPSS